MQDSAQSSWTHPPAQPQQVPGQWSQPHSPVVPYCFQQSSGLPWMSADQYVAAQMQIASQFSHPYAAIPSYGTFWRRFGALAIDMIIAFVLLVMGGFLVALLGGERAIATLENADRFGSAGAILSNVVLVVVTVICNAMGGTPGKRVLGLRITNKDGGLPGFALAVIRAWPWIVVLLCNLAFFMVARNSSNPDSALLGGVSLLAQVIWFIGCFFVLGTKYKQTLHDKLAGTYVIKS